MSKSIRRQIIEQIKATFEGVTEADWGVRFSTVAIGPLGDADQRKRYSVGIVPGAEVYSDLYPYRCRDLNIAIEFRVTVNRTDEDPGLMAEELLATVERIVLKDTTWNGLAIETKLAGNEIDMTTYADRSVMGVLFIQVSYRHALSDPRDPTPSFG
jgi:hypothetical protein